MTKLVYNFELEQKHPEDPLYIRASNNHVASTHPFHDVLIRTNSSGRVTELELPGLPHEMMEPLSELSKLYENILIDSTTVRIILTISSQQVQTNYGTVILDLDANKKLVGIEVI